MSENSHEQLEVPILRHYCKVCKRGFGCAGALGGHMRSHAIGDVNIQHHGDQEKHLINNFRDKPEGNKHPYFLRNNTNRFSSYREIEDRGKCLLDEKHYQLGIRDSSEVEERNVIRQKWRNYDDQHCASSEEEDLANCLVMLSNKSFVLSDNKEENKAKEVEKTGMFQCKACKKVFNSHQALGGHRASHKKVKGCYAARFDSSINDEDNNLEEDFSSNHEDSIAAMDSPDQASRPDLNQISQSTLGVLSRRKAKAHECSICHRVFSSGQALGGHKRCHWLTSNLPDNTFIPNLHEYHYDHDQQLFKKPMFSKPEAFDLNFPPVFLNSNAPETDLSVHNRFAYNDPTQISLQLWSNREDSKNSTQSYHRDNNNGMHGLNSADQDQFKINLLKLSEFKDVNLDGGSSRWLQMGIAPTTDIVAAP